MKFNITEMDIGFLSVWAQVSMGSGQLGFRS